MTTHKPWCACKGTAESGHHLCSTAHQGFQIDSGVVRVSVVAEPSDEPMVCLHPLDDEDGEALVLDAKDARELASLLMWHAGKAEALTEHNHQIDGSDVFFPDCLACRRTARLAALAGQKGVTE